MTAERDALLEEIFGPPEVAAADLHELRAFTHKHTSLARTAGSIAARELCMKVDPTWKLRSLTNEMVTANPGARPRVYGAKVRRAESTKDVIISVAHGAEHMKTVSVSSKNYESLWPCQMKSWQGWLSDLCDIRRLDYELAARMRGYDTELPHPYVHPAIWMTLVWAADSDYTEAVARALLDSGVPMELWKFATTVAPDVNWFRGMGQFPSEWLAMFPEGELAMYLRALVCNGWMTSHQVAAYMGRPMPRGARTTHESWVD